MSPNSTARKFIPLISWLWDESQPHCRVNPNSTAEAALSSPPEQVFGTTTNTQLISRGDPIPTVLACRSRILLVRVPPLLPQEMCIGIAWEMREGATVPARPPFSPSGSCCWSSEGKFGCGTCCAREPVAAQPGCSCRMDDEGELPQADREVWTQKLPEPGLPIRLNLQPYWCQSWGQLCHTDQSLIFQFIVSLGLLWFLHFT